MASITELIEKHKPSAKPKLAKSDRHVREAAGEYAVNLEQRIKWLQQKAAGLPVKSNGRKRAFAEAAVLSFLLSTLRGEKEWTGEAE